MPDTGTPYALRFPGDSDIADVPSDLEKLANDVEIALNGKIATTALGNAPTNTVQKRITVQVGTGTPTGTFAEGDIVFMIPGP